MHAQVDTKTNRECALLSIYRCTLLANLYLHSECGLHVTGPQRSCNRTEQIKSAHRRHLNTPNTHIRMCESQQQRYQEVTN